MPRISFAGFTALALAVALLAACDIPTEPEGIHEEGLTRLAGRMQAQGDDAGAADMYQRALQKKPDDVTALARLGKIFETHGQVEVAESYYTKALKLEPHDQDLQHAEGRVLMYLGRAADARDTYQKILDHDRHDTKAQNGMGIALDFLGQHDEAQKHYRTVLDSSPDDFVTLSNLAHSYVLQGDYSQAIALLEPHASDRAAPVALRQNLAEAYGFAGMYVDAEHMLSTDLKPDDVKRNLAFYRARHDKITPKVFAADLGSYPTKEMAEANAENLRNNFNVQNMTIGVQPEVQKSGGIPTFLVRATGFKDVKSMNDFCAGMARQGITCQAMSN